MTTSTTLQTAFDLAGAMIVGVNKNGDTARVLLELANRADVAVHFIGVTDIESEPNGSMKIQHIAIEQTRHGTLYRFVNANEDSVGRFAVYASAEPTVALY